MLSLETAKELKDAGLKWERMARSCQNEEYPGDTIQTWLPRLDQLLAEIRRLGYEWKLTSNDGQHFIKLLKKNEGRHVMTNCYLGEANSPEEAAALALLWILEQEASV